MDYRLAIQADYLQSETIKPGFYHTYCVEIDIHLLAYNTIAMSDELKNLDKEAS